MPKNHLDIAELRARLSNRFPKLSAKLPALLQLTRADRPIGIYLLLWPTLGALWIAAEGFPPFDLLLIFVLGTALMRSAGCCINDFADEKFDGSVARTNTRPLAIGALTRQDALYTFASLAMISFILVLLTNQLTILLSFGAVAVAGLYPFVKRVSHLPQVVLGVAFSWGILMAFTAVNGSLNPDAFLLFIANCLWTVAYDTEYAMVDREDDLRIGVKSTAILFGNADKMIIGLLQFMFLIAMWLAGRQFDLGLPYFLGLLVALGFLGYQQWLIRDRRPGPCFAAFLNNHWVGAIIFSGIALSYLIT